MCITTQKVGHLNVHSPIQVIQLNFKKTLIINHRWSLAKMNKNGRSIKPIFKKKEKHTGRLCAKIAFKNSFNSKISIRLMYAINPYQY